MQHTVSEFWLHVADPIYIANHFLGMRKHQISH
jgi:hypothetical protein